MIQLKRSVSKPAHQRTEKLINDCRAFLSLSTIIIFAQRRSYCKSCPINTELKNQFQIYFEFNLEFLINIFYNLEY